MNGQEALEKMKGIANGRYFAMDYQYSFNENKIIDVKCGLYIEGFNWYYAPSWGQAFEMLDRDMNKKVPNLDESIMDISEVF